MSDPGSSSTNSRTSSIDSAVISQYEDSLYKPLLDDFDDEVKSGEANSPIESLEVEPLLSFGESCDLIVNLENKTHKAQYLVSSSILQLASTVWAKSINREGFADLSRDSIDGQEYPCLSLEDDDMECLKFLFMILHFQNTEVPRALIFSQLRNMSLICDKYNCWTAVYLWKDLWFNYLIADAGLPGYEDWLFIATRGSYNHGNIVALKRSLVCEASTLSPSKSYFYRYRKDVTGTSRYKVPCELIPQQIIDMVMDKRQRAVLDMIACLQKFAALISGVDHEYNDTKAAICGNSMCQNIALGSFYNSLRETKLGHLVHASSRTSVTWHCSLDELTERIRRLKVMTIVKKEESIACKYRVYHDAYHPQTGNVTMIVPPARSKTGAITHIEKVEPSLIPQPGDTSYLLRQQREVIMEQLKPETEGQCYLYTTYNAPAYRAINYEGTRKPCELALQFGDFRIQIENIYITAY